MLPTEKGRCPDCGCELSTRASLCCEMCHTRRRKVLAEKMELADQVGCQSSPESFELSEIGGGQIAGNGDYRNLPALRSDVHWRIGKHGAG